MLFSRSLSYAIHDCRRTLEWSLGKGIQRSRNQWRKAPFHWMRVNEGFGKEFHRKSKSVKRSGHPVNRRDLKTTFLLKGVLSATLILSKNSCVLTQNLGKSQLISANDSKNRLMFDSTSTKHRLSPQLKSPKCHWGLSISHLRWWERTPNFSALIPFPNLGS